MNIFYLDKDPVISAKGMTNKHIVKMILESAQLLCTAHHILDEDLSPFRDKLYKPTHKNHPSAIWVRESYKNYEWLYEHFVALCDEYTKRYHRVHMTETKLKDILYHLPLNIPLCEATPVRLAITDTSHHSADPVKAYRSYYEAEKLKVPQDIKRYYNIIRGEQC